MTARKKIAAAKSVIEPVIVTTQDEVVTSIKGFDLNWKCRDFQYVVGQTYTHAGSVSACNAGFHAIEGHPLEVFNYYAPGQSRYAEVKQSGSLSRHGGDSKLASAKITIGVELHLHEIVQRAVKWVVNRCTQNEGETAAGTQGAASSTGNQGAASSTGDQGAASSTGTQGAASSTGDQGAASSTGYQGAASSTGDRGAASSTGTQGAASSTGNQGAASSTGYRGAAMATGYEGRVMGTNGNALFLVYRNPNSGEIEHAWAGIVGRDNIKPNVWYCLGAGGKPVAITQ